MIFPVSEKKNAALMALMQKVGVKESDLRESFARSTGSGGQNVNKIESAVSITHIPTGLTVRCQIDRSQALNRFLARRALLEKLDAKVRGLEHPNQDEIERIRRQKQRRKRRSRSRQS